MNKKTWAPNYKHVYGFGPVLKKLEGEVAAIKGRALKGLIQGARVIRKSMDSMPPLIPVEFGNLKKSWYLVTSNDAVITGSSPNFRNDRKDASKLVKNHAKTVKSARREAVRIAKKEGPTVVFGLSAYYAEPVHEMWGRDVKWTRRGSGPGYFDAAVKHSRSQILKEVAKEAKIR